jgi:hypothetical protein
MIVDEAQAFRLSSMELIRCSIDVKTQGEVRICGSVDAALAPRCPDARMPGCPKTEDIL